MDYNTMNNERQSDKYFSTNSGMQGGLSNNYSYEREGGIPDNQLTNVYDQQRMLSGNQNTMYNNGESCRLPSHISRTMNSSTQGGLFGNQPTTMQNNIQENFAGNHSSMDSNLHERQSDLSGNHLPTVEEATKDYDKTGGAFQQNSMCNQDPTMQQFSYSPGAGHVSYHPTINQDTANEISSTLSDYGSDDTSHGSPHVSHQERPVADENAFIQEKDTNQFVQHTMNPAKRAKELAEEMKYSIKGIVSNDDEKLLRIGGNKEFDLH